MENDLKTAAALLRQGQAPGNAEVLTNISVGMSPLRDFICDRYLAEYITAGGAKIKFVTGKPGSGKTHFLQMLSLTADELGFITANFSARDIWLHDFKEIYLEVFKRTDLTSVLRRCANRVIAELGYDPAEINKDMTFADYLVEIGEFHAVTKREIRNQIQSMFLKNPLLDNNFAIACGLLTGGILGHPTLEASNRELLYGWMAGARDIKLAAVRGLGLSPVRITRFNARHMLRSLSEILRMADYPGLLITIDNTEILVSSGTLDTIRYTKIRREDAYESIRELIDDIDTLKNIMFVFAFDRQLLDNESSGLKSYQALWMRVQNEIVSNKFNMFTDIIDLDRYADQNYTREVVVEMSARVADVLNRLGTAHEVYALSEGQAVEIITKAQFSKLSLPRQILLATVENTASPDDDNSEMIPDFFDDFDNQTGGGDFGL